MGYTTTFQGEIKITPELTAKQIKFIEGMFGDMREWNPVEAERLDLTHFDFEFNDNLDGIRWNGAEKFYNAELCMEYLIDQSLKAFPELKFNGILQAQGEEYDDRWHLVVKNNKVTKREIKLKGRKVECPHCEQEFRLED